MRHQLTTCNSIRRITWYFNCLPRISQCQIVDGSCDTKHYKCDVLPTYTTASSKFVVLVGLPRCLPHFVKLGTCAVHTVPQVCSAAVPYGAAPSWGTSRAGTMGMMPAPKSSYKYHADLVANIWYKDNPLSSR